KAMELLPLGPVVFIDTPGLDDEGGLGGLRVQRSLDILNKTDVAILVTTAENGIGPCETRLLERLREKKIPFVTVLNQIDRFPPSDETKAAVAAQSGVPVHAVSCVTREGIEPLKIALSKIVPDETGERHLIGDLLQPGDLVVLVTPIDAAAPKGRLILPQQQVLRDILDTGAAAVVTQVPQLEGVLKGLAAPPRLVVTDSQAFGPVSAIVPETVPLTSFSILFARYKGDLAALMAGAEAVANLKDGDRILIAEGCTHHRQEDDIGTVKIPRMLTKKSGKQLVFDHTSGIQYARNLTDYALIVHCGGCMLNRREMLWRIAQARDAGVPIVNYGVLIAALQGILPRAADVVRN
ncbi:MAG: [FeFe] hydrogenase H-cluster maturation GTPase HydF, partial [Kiritimatiellae bacterium]|nr:[FeFe] hydrogenase H-cluster maturation GTPase HydF [Kiritimatiellia bacterium]